MSVTKDLNNLWSQPSISEVLLVLFKNNNFFLFPSILVFQPYDLMCAVWSWSSYAIKFITDTNQWHLFSHFVSVFPCFLYSYCACPILQPPVVPMVVKICYTVPICQNIYATLTTHNSANLNLIFCQPYLNNSIICYFRWW